MLAWCVKFDRSRSVSNVPGNKLLIVTPWATLCLAKPATNPVKPARAPLDNPRADKGD